MVLLKRKKKGKPINKNDKSLWYTLESNFKNLNGDEFEKIIAKLYRKKGYRVYKTPVGADQGVDLTARKGKMKIIIQAKNWQDKVGNTDVLKTAGARQMQNATYALVITSSGFTKSATEAIRNTPRIRGMGINGLKKEFKKYYRIKKPVEKKTIGSKIKTVFKKIT